MNTENIENLVILLADNPYDPKNNFNVAVEYEKQNQTASAISFYLRAAEYGYESNPLIVYTSLLKMSACFADQQNRNTTVKTSLLQAIEYLPDRPEAYLILSRFHESMGEWQECYTFAQIGMMNSGKKEPLPENVGYPGNHALLFQKAVAGWWLGRKHESFQIFNSLLTMDIEDVYKKAIENNLGLF
jgi:tetratricopeptide (TPR) repeat protein